MCLEIERLIPTTLYWDHKMSRRECSVQSETLNGRHFCSIAGVCIEPIITMHSEGSLPT